jgi:cysteine desulfurase
MARLPDIYLDNAATTPVAPAVVRAIVECLERDFGNPASAHHVGIAAERRVKQAMSALARALGDEGARGGEILWTSGGTEADALGVIGAARARRGRGERIVVSAIEHPAVRESAALLRDEGFDVVQVAPDRAGVVQPEAFAEAITERTAVVALMLVNNEIGTVQPVAEVAKLARQRARDVHVHCDAVQALGKLAVDVSALGADSVAVAAHKIHGPKGSGALWLRRGARLRPLWAGGGQQRGLRAGTLAVPAIAGLGAAAELATADLPERRARFASFRNTLLQAAERSGVPFVENGAGGERAPHIVSLGFAKIPAEPLLHVLESRGVLVSAGSACSERDRKASPVLEAIGVPSDHGVLRFSFGTTTTAAEIDAAAEILVDALRSLV